MRLRLRTMMLIVALLGLGFVSPEPLIALTLIFTCPLWFVGYARQSRSPEGRPPALGGPLEAQPSQPLRI